MNYFRPYAFPADATVGAASDSQFAKAIETPLLQRMFASADSDLFPRIAACYAELRALPRSAPSSVKLHAPASWQRSYRNTCSRGDDGYSIGWLGPWPGPLYCSRSDREW